LTYGFSVTQNQLKTCPQTQREIIDTYFMEHRAKLIDVAAYLDRVDRGQISEPDFRQEAFHQALKILLSEQPYRTRRVLELFSVTDTSIPQSAHGLKGASGAVPLEKERA
jgi:HPt (histidine-containing phosphotransfer) domain-containing protein